MNKKVENVEMKSQSEINEERKRKRDEKIKVTKNKVREIINQSNK